jgi:hypothetical protein
MRSVGNQPQEMEPAREAMFLTPDDLRKLTGYVRPSKQIEWLAKEGLSFRVAADGHPRVLREHLMKSMGVPDIAKRGRTVPDFSSMGA